jgi:LPXTG-motif cell wall anchor domain protein
MAFKNEKSFGFRKAKNVTTIVGTPVGSSVKKVALVTAVGIATLVGANVASADEVQTDNALKTEVSTLPTKIETGISTSVPEGATQEQVAQGIDKAQDTLKSNVKTAKEVGVVVKEGETKEVTINNDNAHQKGEEILTDLAKQEKTLKEATEKQVTNQKAYENSTKDYKETVSKGQDKLQKSAKGVDEVVNEAKKIGINVKEVSSTTSPKYEKLQGLEGEELLKANAENLSLYDKAVEEGVKIQDQSKTELKQAIDTYNADKKAYSDSKAERDLAVSKGQAEIQKSTKSVDEQVALAKKNSLAIAENTTNRKPQYKDVSNLKGDALRKAIKENIKLYNEAVKSATANMDQSSSEANKKINEFLTADAKYKKGIATNTGLKWQNGVTLSGSNGAEKMTGNENVIDEGDHTLRLAGTYATQSLALNQNTDANFDNIFKINGKGTIHVKNTTNGDVDITFSEINSPYNTGTYVAVWGDNNGGIAWSVFALYNGSASSSGGGEAGSTGSGAGIAGRILNYVYSYKAEVATSNGVTVVTFNDIDNTQTVVVVGLDGSKVETGKNITAKGNSYSAGAGDVSQGSSGILDSNGVRWTFEEAKKQNFSFVHSVVGNNTSIVGGIFGSASQIAQAPQKPLLSVKKETVEMPEAPKDVASPSYTVKKVNVDVPQQPEAPKPVEAEVHYYKVTTTPEQPEAPKPQTPQTPQGKVLPHTGTKASTALMLAGLSLAGIGVGVALRKKEEM